MMTDVHIIDKSTGETVAVIPASVGGLDYEANLKEWIDTAWEAAVSDGDVDPAKRDRYEFRFVNKPAPDPPMFPN
ncbi:hypothetical protein A8M77_09650 [Variovorax sp. JS1663]|nr:hypothetical protein A8M77_09650 [Variovorax sp. JS1663]